MLRPSLRSVADELPLIGRFQRLVEFCYGFMGVAILAGMLLWVASSHDRSRALELQYLASHLHQTAVTIQTPIRSLISDATPGSEADKLQNLADRIHLHTIKTSDGDEALIVEFSIDGNGNHIRTAPLPTSDLLGAWLPARNLPSLEFLLLDRRFRIVLAQQETTKPAGFDIPVSTLEAVIGDEQAPSGQALLDDLDETNSRGDAYLVWHRLDGGIGYAVAWVSSADLNLLWLYSHGIIVILYGVIALMFYGGVGFAAYSLLSQLREKRRMLTELAQQHEEHEVLAASVARSPNAVLFVKPCGLIEWVNPAFERMTGYTLEEASGRHPFDLMGSPEQSRHADLRLREAREGSSSMRTTMELYRKDGSGFWADVDFSPVFDDQGQARHFTCVLVDVTTQRELSALVRTTAQIQAEFITSLQHREGFNPDPLLQEILEQMIALTGSRFGFLSTVEQREEGERLVSRTFSNLAWTPDMHRRFEGENKELTFGPSATLLWEPVATGKPVFRHGEGDEANVSKRAPHGHPPISSYLGLPLMAGSRVIGVLGLANAATPYTMEVVEKLEPLTASIALCMVTMSAVAEQQSAQEEANLARTSAELAARAKSNFLAQMSHDLRTPLNAILGWSEAMGTGAVALTPDRTRLYCQQIFQAGRQLQSLIEEILDLSEAEGNRNIPLQPVSLRRCLAEVLVNLRARIHLHDMQIVTNVPRNADIVMGDNRSLFKLVQNALTNAIDHGHRGGRVWVSLTIAPDRRLVLSVADNGPGYPSERLARLFEPFHQDYDAGRATGRGFGLGMAIIKATAERMDGQVQAGRSSHGGAELLVTLHSRESFVEARKAAAHRNGGQARPKSGPNLVLARM